MHISTVALAFQIQRVIWGQILLGKNSEIFLYLLYLPMLSLTQNTM